MSRKTKNGRPHMTRYVRPARKRKLRDADRETLRQVFKEHGAEWTYKALALWFGNMLMSDFEKKHPWTPKREAASEFLMELEYKCTLPAVYQAAVTVDGGWSMDIRNVLAPAA
jgi:hypothetical protein